MSETQVLLSRIAALRQQLEQARDLVKDASSSDDTSLRHTEENPLRQIERQVADGAKQTVLLDTTLRQLTPASSVAEPSLFPKQLTARARRILERGRELLGQLRRLADEIQLERETQPLPHHLATPPASDPLAQRYQETVAMANTALRVIQVLPDAASAQLAFCEGLEIILAVVADRIAGITAMVEQRQRETGEVERLAQLLTALYAKEPVEIQSFVSMAEPLLAEAQQNAPLRFLSARPEQAAQFIASHSLTVAQVIAHVVRQDADFRSNPLEPILAGLLHDVGMLGVPPSVLGQTAPLEDSQRRAIENHTRLGAELLGHLLPSDSWSGRTDFKSVLQEVASGHHERLDGTGYPAGRQEAQLPPLTRLVAVCDVYAALCTARPHRPARDTRTALTDTLLLAEQGALDRHHAERLLQLSFYPVGSVVELADGACGVVVATHMGRRDLTAPARPVLALLTDSQGRYLPVPHHVDLAACENRSIARTLPPAERSTRFGSRYPELV